MTGIPGLIHAGQVAHIRHAPFRHRFTYRLWMLSLDVDGMDRLGLRLFRHNAAGLVSLHDRDHGARDGSALRPWVESQLFRAGLSDYTADLRFLMIPRVLGFAFNPIALVFCRDGDGRLGAVLHQVKNTFGDQHAYVLPVAASRGIVRQEADKKMHVSPFFDMQGGYRFAFSTPEFTPGRIFALSIRYGTEAAPRMTATMKLTASALTDMALLRQLAVMPLMPAKVFSAIHWEALRLWLRGAAFHRTPPSPAQFGTERRV